MPSARHLEERLTDSQSVSQSVSQASSQSGSRWDKQAHTVWPFFQSRTTSKNSGEQQTGRRSWRSSGRTLTTRLRHRWFESQPAVMGAGRSICYSFLASSGSNPSKHELLTPPPKKWYPVSGASKSKNPLGGCFVRQNNYFTRGETSNTMPLGMLREQPPKKGGVRVCACA